MMDWSKYVELSVPQLRKLFDPFKQNVWVEDPVTIEMVREAIQRGSLNATPFLSIRDKGRGPIWTAQEHADRIAYLAVYGWTEPIILDVGVPALGCYVYNPILDGNHRLAAAIFREDETILTETSGAISILETLLP